MRIKKHALKRLAENPLDLRGLLLVFLAGGWLTGILLGFWLAFPQVSSLLGAALSLGITCVFWSKPVVRTTGLVLLCLCLGAWRYAVVTPLNDAHAIRSWIGSGELELQASIVDEPRLENNSTLLTVAVQSVSLNRGRTRQEVDGEIQVQALGAAFDNPYAPRYGDTVQLTGRLTAPPSYSTPEIQASMAFPALSIESRNGNPLLVALYQARSALASILMQVLPQPFAALLIAIFLSLRTPALKPLLPLFNATGTAHLLAPSGFKVTLLAGMVRGGTGWLVPRREARDQSLLPAQRRQGNWRRWLRTLLVVFCIVLYTLLCGGGPAAMRAGIMGILLALAPRLGRSYHVYTALALTALLMSLVDPFVLWDTGFQLSFLGTLGIIVLTPFFQRPLRFLDHLPLGHYLAEIVAVTLAAEVATLPIFALNFDQLSLIAPLANLASVPLLSILLALGALICLSGLISLPLAMLCGWIAWPLLWYVIAAISWCAHQQWAYLTVSTTSGEAWLYYALLSGSYALLKKYWWPAPDDKRARAAPVLSRNVRRALLCGLPLASILITGVLTQVDRSDGHLTITLLTTGSTAQGEALFLRTPGGQTALIDEGVDSATLAQTLDTRLPFWQRSLSLVILASPDASDLAGLQDIVTRYQVGRAIDAGVLHPGEDYARWRSILAGRNIPYTQVRQGLLISLDSQIAFQVLWPSTPLHKSSSETHDNALILRLLAPGLSMLLLNSAAQSAYALQSLVSSAAPSSLRAQIVQVTNEQGKALPAALADVLALAHPSFLLVTTTPFKKGSKPASLANRGSASALPAGSWKILQGMSSFEIQSNAQGWSFS